MTSKTSEQAPEGRTGGGAEGSLGEQLRRAREARGITLREVAEQTRIIIRNLEAIEADDYKALPGGVFNKSFIKSFARYVGFDERRALELYEARAGGASADEVATSPQRSRVYMGETSRSPLVTYGLSLLSLVVLISLVYLGLQFWNNKKAQTASASATPTPAAAPAQQQAAATPTPPPAVEGFKVQLKATRPFWLTSWQEGDKKRRGRFLKPDAPEELEPTAPLTLHYDQVSADALQVTVNGRALRTPTDTSMWTLSKDNYTQFAQ